MQWNPPAGAQFGNLSASSGFDKILVIFARFLVCGFLGFLWERIKVFEILSFWACAKRKNSPEKPMCPGFSDWMIIKGLFLLD